MDELQQALLRREMMKRQAMLDSLAQQKQQADITNQQAARDAQNRGLDIQQQGQDLMNTQRQDVLAETKRKEDAALAAVQPGQPGVSIPTADTSGNMVASAMPADYRADVAPGTTVLATRQRVADAQAAAAQAAADKRAEDAAKEAATAAQRTADQTFTAGENAKNRAKDLQVAGINHPAKEAAPSILGQTDLRTSPNGTQYVNLAGMTGKAKDAARAEAHAAGAVPLEAKDADKLAGIQAVSKNLEDYASTYVPKLATSSATRVPNGLGNLFAGFTQSDPDLATMDKNWIDMVGTLKGAIAGGGVRITQAEINKLMTENAPSKFDTQEVAKKKIGYLVGLLKGEESAILGTSGKGGGESADQRTARLRKLAGL